MVKGKIEDESETTDSVEKFDLGEPNHMKVRRIRGWSKLTPKQRSGRAKWGQCHDNEGAKKGLKGGQVDRRR